MRWTNVGLTKYSQPMRFFIVLFFSAIFLTPTSHAGGSLSFLRVAPPRENQRGIPSDAELKRVKDWLRSEASILAHETHTNLHRENPEITKLYEQALPTPRKTGLLSAQAELALLYDEGDKKVINIPPVRDEAIYWSTLCAAKGDSNCLNRLGTIFGRTFKGFTPNHRLEFCLYQMAAAKNNGAADNNLGYCYEKGIGGVQKDLASAYYFFNQSASKGHEAGLFHMGLCHYFGWSVPINYTEAARYFKLAAAQGYAPAHEKIAEMVSAGRMSLDEPKPVTPLPEEPPAYDAIKTSD